MINSTNFAMNLLYFLHISVICCINIVKSLWQSFNIFGRIYGYVRFNFSISVTGFKYMQKILQRIGYFIRFSLSLSLKLSFLTKPIFPKFCDSFNESLLRLRETRNALKLSVFFFSFFSFSLFCQRYPKYREIRSKKLLYRPSNS